MTLWNIHLRSTSPLSRASLSAIIHLFVINESLLIWINSYWKMTDNTALCQIIQKLVQSIGTPCGKYCKSINLDLKLLYVLYETRRIASSFEMCFICSIVFPYFIKLLIRRKFIRSPPPLRLTLFVNWFHRLNPTRSGIKLFSGIHLFKTLSWWSYQRFS